MVIGLNSDWPIPILINWWNKAYIAYSCSVVKPILIKQCKSLPNWLSRSGKD